MELYNLPFNVEKWMSSPSVRSMSRIEQGAYLLLLVEAWSRDCLLDTETIKRIENDGGAQWKRACSRVVSDMFSVGNDGEITNKTLSACWEEALTKSKKRSDKCRESALEGWKKRKRTQCERNANAMPSQCERMVSISISSTKSISKEKSIKKKDANAERPQETLEELVVINDWNQLAAECDLPNVIVPIGEKRMAGLRNRIKDGMMDHWEQVKANIRAHNFLRGNNDRGWRIDFTTLVERGDMWRKIAEGKYGRKETDKSDIPF